MGSIDIEFTEHVDEPRPRTFHHTALVALGESPLTITRLNAIAAALVQAPQVPPWAIVQVSNLRIYVYWQTTDAGSKSTD